MTVQSKFNVTLPTTDTGGNALVVGQVTQLDFVVTDGSAPAQTYTFAVPAATPVGASLVVPFSAVGFTPVAGSTYGADVFAVDANGNGAPSGAISWTEGAVPAAPTGFSVA